jgi:16S rRNA A1518/A1519 N6-dimethyltransferase RsmA/KsgA/DIM1 with predicted DNA glycosylase/AP lyase activity
VYIKAKKSLGQNFLIDRDVLEKIVSTTDIVNKEVLEIGPGSGNLTTYILKQKPKKLYVVEKDDDLAILLKEKFDSEIEIINDDILKFQIKNYLSLVIYHTTYQQKFCQNGFLILVQIFGLKVSY